MTHEPVAGVATGTSVRTERTEMPEEQETKTQTLVGATEELVQWFADMKRKYRLSENTMLDLFRIQLMWTEQAARLPQPSGQELIDRIAEEVEAAKADEEPAEDVE